LILTGSRINREQQMHGKTIDGPITPSLAEPACVGAEMDKRSVLWDIDALFAKDVPAGPFS
jgi:hypothetical protein